MPEDPPKVVVTFYSNFRYRETDISDVDQTAASAVNGHLVYAVTENLMELIEEEHEPEEVFVAKFELIETRHYTEELGLPVGQSVPMRVKATEGTWRIKIHWNDYMKTPIFDGEGHEIGTEEREPTVSAPIPANFTASDVLAAFAGTLLQPLPNTGSGLEEPAQPIALFVETQVFYKKGEATRPPGYSTEHQMKQEGMPGAYIQCEDIGPQEVNFRLFGAFTNFQLGVTMENIDLAGVIEKVPESDKVEYERPLEFGCTGAGEPVHVPPGVVKPEGGTSGAKAHHRPVSGQ